MVFCQATRRWVSLAMAGGAVMALLAVPSSAAGSTQAGPLATTAANTNRVALRALVVAVDGADFGVATWTAELDRLGAAYDVLLTRTSPLDTATLVRADGTGRYNAILLTDASLLYADGGGYVSGLTPAEWNLLWGYERDYGVRQATLYAAPGTWPEDTCLQAVSEGSVGDTPILATLTSIGATVFDYLRAGAQVPISASYVYRTSVRAGCAAKPVLQVGSDVLGVLSTAADGRERLALTFTSNPNLRQAELLVYGLIRWASRGLFLGDQRHYLNVDVDDWFNSTAHYQIPGGPAVDPHFRLTAHDAYNAYLQQLALRRQYPVADGFTFNLAYNGGGADLTATAACSPDGGVAALTATTLCLKDSFRWVNHTKSHPALNTTDYPTTYAQVADNLAIARTLGLSTNPAILKTPEYSGLGVYSADPTDTIDPPTDHGLAASNPALIQVAVNLGITVLHGNMSFASHRPPCFNCGTPHPLAPTLKVVPDWPTNIAYHTTTPQEQVSYYNAYYGPGGLFPRWPRDLTYSEVISAETDIALSHVTSGSIYAHTFHIANLHDYGSGATLVTDWVSSLVGKYDASYQVPLINLDWTALARYTATRNAHFVALAVGVDAVYDRSTGRISVRSPATGSVLITGARATGYTTYGTDVSAVLSLRAGTTVTVNAKVHT